MFVVDRKQFPDITNVRKHVFKLLDLSLFYLLIYLFIFNEFISQYKHTYNRIMF